MDRSATETADRIADLSGLTAAVARFVPALRFQDLTPEVLRISRRCVLDGLAVMLAGTEQPGMAPLARRGAVERHGRPRHGLGRHAARRGPRPALRPPDAPDGAAPRRGARPLRPGRERTRPAG